MLGRLGQVASSVLDRLGVTREEDSWELVTDPGPEVPELAAEVASATAASGAEFRAANFVPTIDFVEEEAGALFATTTNTALGEWHFERLAGLEADPDFPSPGVARARLARAVRAGLGARYKLDRRARTTCKSPQVPGIKRWYVVLRSRDFPEGFITRTTLFTAARFNPLAADGSVLIPRVCLIHSLLWQRWLRSLPGAEGMATSGTVRGRLSQTAILDLLSGWTAGKPLPVLHFCSPSDHLDQLWTSIAF